MFDFWTWLCIGSIVTVLLIVLIAVLIWKFLAPDKGVGSKHPYAGTGPPPLAPGTHKSHTYAQGVEAGIAPDGGSAPPCPSCGRPGTFDTSRHTFYCGTCRKWF